MMRVIVDNSAGGDAQLAADVERGLRDRGFDVELRAPPRGASFDTGIHPIGIGIVIRVPHRPDSVAASAIEDVVRDALMRRPSLRRRSRAVPVHLGDTARLIEWIDVFG